MNEYRCNITLSLQLLFVKRWVATSQYRRDMYKAHSKDYITDPSSWKFIYGSAK